MPVAVQVIVGPLQVAQIVAVRARGPIAFLGVGMIIGPASRVSGRHVLAVVTQERRRLRRVGSDGSLWTLPAIQGAGTRPTVLMLVPL
jgi:hypothetical protein